MATDTSPFLRTSEVFPIHPDSSQDSFYDMLPKESMGPFHSSSLLVTHGSHPSPFACFGCPLDTSANCCKPGPASTAGTCISTDDEDMDAVRTPFATFASGSTLSSSASMDEDDASDYNMGEDLWKVEYDMMKGIIFGDYIPSDTDTDSDSVDNYDDLAESLSAKLEEPSPSRTTYAPGTTYKMSDRVPTTALHFQTADAMAVRNVPQLYSDSLASLSSTLSASLFATLSNDVCSVPSNSSQISCSSNYSMSSCVSAYSMCSSSSSSGSNRRALEVLVSRSCMDEEDQVTGPWMAIFGIPEMAENAPLCPVFRGGFPTPLGSLYSVASSADGTVVAGCGEEGMLVVMQLQAPTSPQELYTVARSWVLVLGGERSSQPDEFQEAPDMLNSVKFGMVAGEEKIIVASQDGYLYLFDLPDSTPSSPTPYSPHPYTTPATTDPCWPICSSLPHSSPASPPPALPHFSPAAPAAVDAPLASEFRYLRTDPSSSPLLHCWRPVFGAKFNQGPAPKYSADFSEEVMDAWEQASGAQVMNTLALGKFDAALNFAVASSDGKWLGVTLDQPYVMLVSTGSSSPTSRKLFFPVKSCPPYTRRTPACQNTAFNSSSTLLAAPCDFSLSVFCWSVTTGDLLLHLSDHLRPCIALSFLPPSVPLSEGGEAAGKVHDSLLAYAQDAGRVHVVDVHHPSSLQTLPVTGPTSTQPLERINGLGISPCGSVMAAGWHALHKWQLLLDWSPRQHRDFPPAFKAAVRTLLMASHTSPTTGLPTHPTEDGSRGLYDIPTGALHKIFALAAFPLGAWEAQPEAGCSKQHPQLPRVQPLLPVPEELRGRC